MIKKIMHKSFYIIIIRTYLLTYPEVHGPLIIISYTSNNFKIVIITTISL
jgi:hypothetical protein